MKVSIQSKLQADSTIPRIPGKALQQVRQSGFSLLEILVVLAMLAVLSTIGATMFLRMADAWRTVQARTEVYRQSNAFFEQFRDDVRRMPASDQSGMALHGLAVEYTESDSALPLYDVPRIVDQVTLPVMLPVSEGGYEGPYAVTYAVDNSVSPPVLRRSTRPLESLEGDPATPLSPREVAASQVLLEGVIALRFEFYDGAGAPQDDSAWTSSWDKDNHPKAIRTSLVLAHPDRLDRQWSRQATCFTALQ